MHPANRLSRERSPYLLQHAHNPVDWYPWGEEAFDKAGREDKPVFLSVGYSACHWCHVMERESFEDERTARLLNKHFVSIKVDREERPDVDQIYQLAHQVLTQRAGGWPLSMFLLPDKRPFFGGTYFPDARRHGMPSFTDVLQAILEAYQSRRGDVDGQAAELLRVLVRVTTAPAAPGAALEAAALEAAALDDAAAQALRRAEKTYGGFGRAPKFPNTMALDVLLCAGALRGHEEARGHALLTLDRMARGGIYDQLGGGFARYSTDERWLVPHFEKMLYDNAQLARLYLDGWRARGDRAPGEHPRERYRAVVAEVLAYVLREMTDPAGVFYSAQDADSEGEEGKFFVWTPAEVEAVVGKDDAPRVCAYFDVTAEGNFEDHKSVLWTPRPLDEVARAVGGSPDEITRAVERARPLLFAARERRPKPARDDKCLASWNALMISALADAGATLAEPSWVAAAEAALDAWRARAWRDGRLAHAIKQGEAYGAAFLDDYAGLARAAIDVYEATFDPRHLGFARTLCDATLDLFSDDAAGDLFFTPRDGEVVLHRTKDASDHAYPGGVGLAADALLRLGALTGVPRYRDAAERLLGTTAQAARESPLGFGSVTRAVDRAARGGVEVVVVGDAARDETRALLHAAREVYVPHRTLVCVADEPDGARHGIDPALVRGRAAGAGGTPTAYVCRAGVCAAPVGTPEALVAALRAAVGGV